jgi:hypothetical protein
MSAGDSANIKAGGYGEDLAVIMKDGKIFKDTPSK